MVHQPADLPTLIPPTKEVQDHNDVAAFDLLKPAHAAVNNVEFTNDFNAARFIKTL